MENPSSETFLVKDTRSDIVRPGKTKTEVKRAAAAAMQEGPQDVWAAVKGARIKSALEAVAAAWL